MKKLLAVALLLCLVFSCAPAVAGSVKTYTPIPNVLDLSKGPVRITFESDSLDEALKNDDFRMALSVGFLWSSSITTSALEDPYVDFSIDGDSTADIRMTTYESEKTYGANALIEALPTQSCGALYTVTTKVPDNYEDSPDFEAVYYSPLTIIFVSEASDSVGDYSIDENGATFVRPNKTSVTSLKIPDTISVRGKPVPVTKIEQNALRNHQKKLTKVTIGKNVKEIGRNAFYGCLNLKTVKGGANLEIIGGSAFQGCKKLTKFTVGAKVKEIGKKAFFKCASLKTLTIKSKLLTADTVGASAFKGINAQATVKVPKAVKKDYSKWLLKKGIKKTMKIK